MLLKPPLKQTIKDRVMDGKRQVFKFINFILFFLLAYAFASPIQAANIEGFRGLKWGDPLPKEGMTFIEKNPESGGVYSYTRDNDKLKIGAAKLERITYKFWQNKLFSVHIEYSESHNFSALLAAFTEKYGKPNLQPGTAGILQSYTWGEKDVAIIMICHIRVGDLGRGFVLLTSLKIFMETENWDKEQAKKAKEDL